MTGNIDIAMTTTTSLRSSRIRNMALKMFFFVFGANSKRCIHLKSNNIALFN